eukprot:GHVU01006897.1.p1 GENE.GHVU01006897.1~~GHVU01006897.1.p1  ORF type:complete len:229 (+),score=45.32 GHVU01006897.1:200-886(+)
MDNLINLGTKAFQQYSDNNNKSSQHDRPDGHAQGEGGGYGVTGGAHLNRPAGGQWIDTDGDGVPDFQQAADHAARESGDAADPSLFKNAMSFLKNRNNKDHDDIDESKATDAHDQAYNKGQGGSLDANSMGAAAALQAFKKFSSGGGSDSKSSSGGDGQSKLIGMAMAQAAKLFDSSGGASSGQKQDAVNSAGQMVMKLLMKQKMNEMVGGGNSGGLSGLAGLAGKLM